MQKAVRTATPWDRGPESVRIPCGAIVAHFCPAACWAASVFLGFPRPGREPLPPVHPRECCAGGKSGRAVERSYDGGTPRQGTLRSHGSADQCSGSRAFNPDGRIAAGWTTAIMGPSTRRSGLGVSHLSTGLYVALKVCREDRWQMLHFPVATGLPQECEVFIGSKGYSNRCGVERDRIR